MPGDTPTTPQNDSKPAVDESRPTTSRKPYVAPRLRHLGSVRDLTLGASASAGEGGMMAAM